MANSPHFFPARRSSYLPLLHSVQTWALKSEIIDSVDSTCENLEFPHVNRIHHQPPDLSFHLYQETPCCCPPQPCRMRSFSGGKVIGHFTLCQKTADPAVQREAGKAVATKRRSKETSTLKAKFVELSKAQLRFFQWIILYARPLLGPAFPIYI